MHTFPQLRKIERKYGDKVVVVGVPSPKFPAEREPANWREAVPRYRIEHPVVNDRDFAVWQRFGGRAWPTLMFIDPEGRVIGKREGELPFEQFDPLVAGMLKEFEERGLLHAPASTIALEKIREPARTLSFPGKVLATKDGLFIADSNHHRIVFTGFDGSIRRTYGSGEPGFADGPAERAAFQQPQGMARSGSTLYVADTENHAIRSIDLESGLVTTLAGTGEQALRPGPGAPGPAAAPRPPPDPALADRLPYIPMAGTHQIWTLDLDPGAVAPFAGTGREGLLDGPRDEAWFAQSSGLTILDGHLFVADSEVSAVRDIDLHTALVPTLVGEDLIDSRAQDGECEWVRLQHPLGIIGPDSSLLVADIHHDAIKRLD